MTDEELAMELRKVWVPDHSLKPGPYPEDWLATARRARELLPAMTEAERELIEAALEWESSGSYVHSKAVACGCVWCHFRGTAAKVREERNPKPRYEVHPGVDKHHEEAGIYDNVGRCRLTRDEVAELLNRQP